MRADSACCVNLAKQIRVTQFSSDEGGVRSRKMELHLPSTEPRVLHVSGIERDILFTNTTTFGLFAIVRFCYFERIMSFYLIFFGLY